VDDVRFAGSAALAFMLFLAEGPGGANEIKVVMRTVRADCFEDPLEADTEVIVD
jgi:hypothetical protein